MLKATFPQQQQQQQQKQDRMQETQFDSGVQTSLMLQKLLAFLYTHNTIRMRRKETTLWTMMISTQRKCLGDHLTHDIKDT